MTILELLKEDNIKVSRQMNSTYGPKHESPCPSCGGNNCFHIWTERQEGGKFWCRKCKKSGDVINYLMIFRGMDYNKACDVSGIYPARKTIWNRKPRTANADHTIPCYESPSLQWQHQANSLLEWSIKCLWDEKYIKVREWLNNERGFTDDTIKLGNLGWIPHDIYLERSSFGLPEKLKEGGVPYKLRIPSGLVIPCFINEIIQRLRIRVRNPKDGSKYWQIEGSSSIPMVLGNKDVFIIIESDLDALLLNQIAGDIIGVISLGSAYFKPDADIYSILKNAGKVLVSLDSDESGAEISWKWWLSDFPNAIRWPIIRGKDPAEAYLNGLNLRKWIELGINESVARPSSNVQCPHIVENNMPDILTRPLIDTATLVKNLENFGLVKTPRGVIKECYPTIGISLNIAETGHSDGTILSICDNFNPSVIIDMPAIQTTEVISALNKFMRCPAEKVFYDAKQAIKTLYEFGITVEGPIYDVMLADQILRAGLKDKKRTLDDVVEEYIEGTATEPSDNMPSILIKLKEITEAKFIENGLTETAELEFTCIPATAAMEINGMCIDKNKLVEMREAITAAKEKLEVVLHGELGDINLNSPLQLLETLKSKGIIIGDTKHDTLLKHASEHPFISDLIEYKKLQYNFGLIENLIEHINPITGRIHPNYAQIGAPTGRFSCSEPNIQGISKAEEIRSCFIASEGSMLVIADYSQIELRIVAEISGDERMINAYKNGEDLHKLTASLITGKPLDEITKEDRQAAKAVNFGLIYAMGAKGLRDYAEKQYGVLMTEQQASDFRNKFFEAYNGIYNWHQSVQSTQDRQTRTLGNRRRIWQDAPKITETLNSPIQGTSADIIKMALCLLHNKISGTDIKVVACIHDEIILEAPINEVEKAQEILRDSMVEAGQVYLKNVPVVVDVSVVGNWSEKA